MVEVKEKVWTDKEYTDAVASAYKAGAREVVMWVIRANENSGAKVSFPKVKLEAWGISLDNH